jgi:hypothetical protein
MPAIEVPPNFITIRAMGLSLSALRAFGPRGYGDDDNGAP